MKESVLVSPLDAAVAKQPKACVLALQTSSAAPRIDAQLLRALEHASKRVFVLVLPTLATAPVHLISNAA